MKKRTLTARFLCVCLAIGTLCTGCGKDDTKTEQETTEKTETTSEAAAETSIEETVLVDEQDVKVTAKRFGEYKEEVYSADQALIMEVENNTDKKISVALRNSSVNGYMVDTEFSRDFEPGETGIFPGVFNESTLEYCGIETVSEIEFSVEVTSYTKVSEEEEETEVIIETDPITICTSEWDTYMNAFDESGTVAYDKDGIKIVVRDAVTDDILGAEIPIYVSNQTDKFISVGAFEGELNGKKTEIYYGADVLPGKHSVNLLGPSVDEALEKIDSAKLTFSIMDFETGETIVEKTEPLSITY